MSTKSSVLSILQCQTDYISGTTLSHQLDVTRNTIWKAIQALKQEGYIIDTNAKGYKLTVTPTQLNQTLIQAAFPQGDMFTYDSITSTNSQAKQYADTLKKDFAVFIANEQTMGKGRFGRPFYSPKQSGLYMSLLYPSKDIQTYLHLVTPLTAIAVLKAIKTVTGITPSIKWVNDLFYHQKKITGILTEAITNIETGQVEHIIIGIGINLYKPTDLPNELKHIFGYISDTPINVNALVIAIIDNILTLLAQLPNTSFLEDYKKHCFILGKNITVYPTQQTHYTAKAIDIDDNGQLIIQTDDTQLHTLQFGEISIRF
ncbi:biotin--[acetyl-CoA-carboxylase] ligase [Granulicatella sp. zg-ZJ]|uniref:biotin--[acetyl-CoA-carboxylase] ligase n=1 Tax=unclassified Granulicatella TaxID=2630493 RepID=UPI0013C08E90|nr:MULTISPECIES: biotin--[acetyl-CoA-carboxylase] ligase [unclassified Granulicatella]NEW62528.1 biotin--[acetyl-CoA-carboxylase] ligase [Granulicatella sp. zg-ZJ]NEW66575.1 biotin--[acetyl-CoA-carboxylase] ligase [Granulicatella sp. zg-84]QMI85776.1 biotin--[acetyl-CoA-carboxylase] ligase [Carnobacteriaceae bacterium zg-84]